MRPRLRLQININGFFVNLSVAGLFVAEMKYHGDIEITEFHEVVYFRELIYS